MADLISDGKLRVYWVAGATSISNIAAPTAVELTAGIRLDTNMTPDGLSIGAKTDDVDTSSLSSTFDTKRAGRRGYDNSVKVKAQDSADTIRTTMVYRANGFLAVRRNLDAGTAWAAAQKVEIYPSECGEPTPGYGPNSIQTFEVPLLNHTEPNTVAVVA